MCIQLIAVVKVPRYDLSSPWEILSGLNEYGLGMAGRALSLGRGRGHIDRGSIVWSKASAQYYIHPDVLAFCIETSRVCRPCDSDNSM
jgi:hypothetical protein